MSVDNEIAVVEDDSFVRAALEGLIRSLGMRCHAFGRAEDCLDALARRPFACLITDVQMPGMDGFDLVSELASRGAKLPVIFITAFPEPEVMARALGMGAIEVLAKPFSPPALIGCIERALERP